MVALGTSIVTSLLQSSDISRQSRQISTLNHEESADRKAISTLQAELQAKTVSATASSQQISRVVMSPRSCYAIGQPGFAVASPEFLLTIRQASLTAWNALAGIPFSSVTSASGHCGYALPWKYQLLPLSAKIRP